MVPVPHVSSMVGKFFLANAWEMLAERVSAIHD